MLSAQHVWRWKGTDGHYYLYLHGESSALQGVDGLRASEAVARIVSLSQGDGPPYQVDVFAEDAVPGTGKKPRSIPNHRARFRATKVEMEAYLPQGMSELKTPPRPFGLLQRSGFLAPRRPPAQNAAVAARSPQTRAYALSPVQSPPQNTDFGQADRTVSGMTVGAGLPDNPPAIGQPNPKRDPMLIPAQMRSNRPPGPDQDGDDSSPDDPPVQAPSVAQSPPGGTAQPPAIDLAPIEGAPPGVPGIGVPNLTPEFREPATGDRGFAGPGRLRSQRAVTKRSPGPGPAR